MTTSSTADAAAAFAGISYGATIISALQRYPDREAFVLGERSVTYAEVSKQLSRMQQVLATFGIGHGGGVGALTPNLPEVWIYQAASNLIGSRYTGLHPLGSVEDHVWICDDAEIEVLAVHPLFAEVGRAVLERSTSVRHLLVFGESEVGENLYSLMADHEPRPLEPGPATEDDVSWLQYTGGTTGRPKGVMVAGRAMVELAKVAQTSWQLPEVPRYLVAAPITHAGVLPVFATLSRGGTVILMQSFEPKSYVKEIERVRANCTFGVPTMINAILDHTTPEDGDLSSLETFIYGAAPISPTRLTQALDRFGGKLVQIYGQTECAGVATSLHREEHDPHGRPELLTSCGRPVLGTAIRVVDADGADVPDGTPGELVVRSRAVMAGYWKLPELTETTLRGGWLHTGDVVIRDTQGYLTIVDRTKDLIITGGFNVYPKEVEDAISIHPAVAAVAVVGLPDPKWGEAVTAFVVLHDRQTVEVAELQRIVHDAKGSHQTPKAVHFIEELPQTAVGKIDKKQLRARDMRAGQA